MRSRVSLSLLSLLLFTMAACSTAGNEFPDQPRSFARAAMDAQQPSDASEVADLVKRMMAGEAPATGPYQVTAIFTPIEDVSPTQVTGKVVPTTHGFDLTVVQGVKRSHLLSVEGDWWDEIDQGWKSLVTPELYWALNGFGICLTHPSVFDDALHSLSFGYEFVEIETVNGIEAFHIRTTPRPGFYVVVGEITEFLDIWATAEGVIVQTVRTLEPSADPESVGGSVRWTMRPDPDLVIDPPLANSIVPPGPEDFQIAAHNLLQRAMIAALVFHVDEGAFPTYLDSAALSEIEQRISYVDSIDTAIDGNVYLEADSESLLLVTRSGDGRWYCTANQLGYRTFGSGTASSEVDELSECAEQQW